MGRERISWPYRIVIGIAGPVVRWWGRLQVTGLQHVPESGPLVLMANHDSMWDPLVVGAAAISRRQVRALAKASLWKNPVVARVLDGMGQIPIERGRGDTAALQAAIDQLEAGGCIGVFPEGTISRGKPMRALSGAGRLVLAVPGTYVLGARVLNSVDIVRFPKRPRLRVEFFVPEGGQPREGETAVGLTKRVMTEARAGAPPAIPGRRRKAAALRAEID